jgi:excisionase family DNA binding protein
LRLTGGENSSWPQKIPNKRTPTNQRINHSGVADWAKVSTKTIHRWISDNKIPAILLGNRKYRIPEKAIIDYLRQNGYDHLLPSSFAVASCDCGKNEINVDEMLGASQRKRVSKKIRYSSLVSRVQNVLHGPTSYVFVDEA